VSGRQPVHVWWTARADIAKLDTRALAKVLERSIRVGQERFGCRIASFAISPARVDLLCEADDSGALARCLQGLAIRMAKQLNRALDRRGRVWTERYRQEVLVSGAQLRVAQRSARRWIDAAGATCALLTRGAAKRK
jgi:hypothetical protein